MATQGISTKAAESNTQRPFIDREAIHAQLMFLSSAVGAMDGDGRINFNENAEFALCIFLSEIARKILPEPQDGGEVRS